MADRVVQNRDTGTLAGQITPLRKHDLKQRQQLQEEPDELQTMEEQEGQRQGRRDEEPQAKPEEEESLQTQEDDEEQLQSQADEELQEKPEENEGESLQTKVDDEEQLQSQADDELQEKSELDDGESVQASAVASVEPLGSISVEINARKGLGSPLPSGVRLEMENYFAADFTGLRIHTDGVASKLNRALRSQAFAHGRDIFFAAGKYNPYTRSGQHLLAHELTHTIQQRAVNSEEVTRSAESGIQYKEDETIRVRPEILQAIRLARSEIGKVNAKKTSDDGTRIGWQRLHEYFKTAFDGKDTIPVAVIRQIVKVATDTGKKDAMPAWCGVFVWWAMKKAGIPMPSWKQARSIISASTRRPTGQLPQKGDIAYREKHSHFALVTGVEAAASREGKSTQAIRVATINGNTSGDDNLGGQIEEKWEPLSRWHSFFDVLGKLDLPEVEFVEVPVIPDEESEAAPIEAEVAGASAELVEEGIGYDAADIEIDPAAIDAPSAAASAINVELPPEPVPVAREEVAVVEELSMEGSSDKAMTQFTDAPASQMAKAHPSLGNAVQGKLGSERADTVDNAPVLAAKTSGEVDAGITPPDQIPLPGDASVTDGTREPDAADLQPDAHAHLGAPPSNDQNRRLLDDQDRRGDLIAWLKANMAAFLSRISTTDPKLNTSAGPAPRIKLKGEADLRRMHAQRTDAQTQVRNQRDSVSAKLRQHPGQSNIQPKEVNEERKAEFPRALEGSVDTPADESMAEYVQAPLPQDVRNKSDEMLAPTLEASLAPAREKTVTAAKKRDTDKQQEIDQAEAQAKEINESADRDQREIVISNRKKVAEQQKSGIVEAYEEVNTFGRDAEKEQKKTQTAVSDKVKTAEGDAKKELKKGEKEAENEKRKAEEKAKRKKQELKRKQKKRSWWQRAKDAVKSAVSALTEFIDKAFNAARKLIKKAIDKAKNFAVSLINKARKWIVNKVNDFRNWAKKQVNKYLNDRFPGLAKRINGAIDRAVDTAIDGVNRVADAAIAGIEKLAAALSAALDKILSVFQTALKAAVQIAGAVLTGEFAEALRIAIRAACEIAGIDSSRIFGFIDRAKQAVMKILKDPVGFFGNLARAVGAGLRNFGKNIRKHLINGLLGWLTGAMSNVPITMPEKLDLKGVLSLAMQILGLTYENIKARIIKRFPPAEKIFNLIEKGFALIKKVAVEGPIALWNEVKQRLTNFKEQVLGEIRNLVIVTVTKEAIGYVLGMLNPAGAIVKVVQLLYRFVTFLIDRFNQIRDFVVSVYNTLAEMVAGNFAKVTAAVEDALARSLPVILSLLAKLAGLGGIGKTIQKILKTARKPINRVIDKVVDKVVRFAKKLIGRGKGAAKKAKQAGREVLSKFVDWWKIKLGFKATDGSRHTLLFNGVGKNARLMIRTKAMPYTFFLQSIKLGPERPNETKEMKDKRKALPKAIEIAKAIDHKRTERLGAMDKKGKALARKKKAKVIEGLVSELRDQTKFLFTFDLPTSDVTLTPGSLNVFAGSMRAYPLTRIQDPKWKGSRPSDPNAKFDILNQRRYSGGSAYYIQGHLLNQKLGGPGKWNNMTALSVSANSRHERKAESLVKAGVDAGGTMEYEVTPVFVKRGGEAGLIKKFEKRFNKKDTASLTKILEVEKDVPESLSIKIRRFEPKPAGNGYKGFKVVKKDSANVDKIVDRNPDSYFLSGSRRIQPIDLNQLSPSNQPGEEGPRIDKRLLSKLTKAVVNRQSQSGSKPKKFGEYRVLAREAKLHEAKTLAKQFEELRKNGYLVLR